MPAAVMLQPKRPAAAAPGCPQRSPAAAMPRHGRHQLLGRQPRQAGSGVHLAGVAAGARRPACAVQVCRAALSTGRPGPAGHADKATPMRTLTEEKEEITFREVMKTLKIYAWPDGQPEIKVHPLPPPPPPVCALRGRMTGRWRWLCQKVRVVAALALLVTSKVANVQVPMIFKMAIDNLNDANVVRSILQNGTSSPTQTPPTAPPPPPPWLCFGSPCRYPAARSCWSLPACCCPTAWPGPARRCATSSATRCSQRSQPRRSGRSGLKHSRGRGRHLADTLSKF